MEKIRISQRKVKKIVSTKKKIIKKTIIGRDQTIHENGGKSIQVANSSTNE
jgi:hypothetical protein